MDFFFFKIPFPVLRMDFLNLEWKMKLVFVFNR